MLKKWICRLLFFIPAIVALLMFIWVFIYPYSNVPEQIDVPIGIWLLLAGFWVSGILLSYNQFYGGIVAVILPIYDYMCSLSGNAGHRHVDTLSYVIGLAIFYAVCGYIAFKNKRQHIVK